MISFRQVADRHPDVPAAAVEVREALADLHAQHELWPEPAAQVEVQPPMPRYRRIG